MKTIIISSLIGLMLFLSCNKEPEDQPETSFRIKRTLHYGDFLDTIPVHIKEFKYDHKNRIEYIYQYSKFNNFSAYYIYESFLYNDSDFLMKKITFHGSTDSWRLSDSTIYEYSGSNLTSEITYFYNGGTNAYKYFYDHSKIIEKRHYYLSKFTNLIKYEYSEELCIKEFEYRDSLGLDLRIYTIHGYINNLLSKTEKFWNRDDCNFNNITYTYDANGNLTLEDSVQDLDCGQVKNFAYLTRYEYEEYQVIK